MCINMYNSVLVFCASAGDDRDPFARRLNSAELNAELRRYPCVALTFGRVKFRIKHTQIVRIKHTQNNLDVFKWFHWLHVGCHTYIYKF